MPNWSRIRQFDEFLKVQGINPGTSADVTVCSLLIFGLLEPDYSAWASGLAEHPFTKGGLC